MTKKKSLGLVILLSSIIVACLYSDVVLHLNEYLFSTQADGLPNYFSFIYHIKHDANYFVFQGMSYPYGETIFMVDCHPLVANVLKFISQNIVDISPYTIGIINFFLLGSLVLCSVFMFLILDYHKFPWYTAITGAISIAFLSSNVLLWQYGHWALTYSWFFPISWYLILKYFSSKNKIKYSILILANTLFWFYTHNYLGLSILVFTFGVHLFSFILNRNKLDYKTIVALTLQVIIPILIVYTVISISDTHSGRIELFFSLDHRASIYSVFFPNHSYLRPIYALFFDLSPQNDQSWCQIGNYIGLSTNLIIVATLLFLLFHLIVHRKWQLRELLSNSEVAMLLSATALLLYSMAIPFRYGMDFLLPTIIKQFVAIGRFAWPFYFVIIVTSLLLVRKLFKEKVATAISLVAIGLLFSEGLSYHLKMRNEISKNKNIFHQDARLEKTCPKLKALDFSEYQAIIPIPFYHRYLSLNSFASSDKTEGLSMWLSYTTGLPLMSAILSRPSIFESRNIVQIFIPPYYNKPIQNALNNKPFLVIFSKENHLPIEDGLLSKSHKIFENEAFELYKLPVDSLFSTDNTKYVQEFTAHKNGYTLDKPSGYYVKEEERIYHESFDTLKCEVTYRGNGALFLEKKAFNTIFKSQPNQFSKGVEYNLSFWYYSYIYDQTFNIIRIDVTNSEGKILRTNSIDPAVSNVYDGNWAYNEIPFTLDNESDYIVLSSHGAKLFSDTTYIDELLIRPTNRNIFKPISSANGTIKAIIKNNEMIPLMH